jgi:hypothetical protein
MAWMIIIIVLVIIGRTTSILAPQTCKKFRNASNNDYLGVRPAIVEV